MSIVDSSFVAVRSGGIVGTPSALPSHFRLIGGFLVGPQGDLANSGLSGIDLSDRILTGANLTGQYLMDAKLTGANFTGADFTGLVSVGLTGVPTALPVGYELVDGAIVATP